MDNTIYFCSLPFLDSSYQNVIDFSSLSSQYQYFSSQVKKQLKANVVSDSERTTITINAELSSISKYDYLFLIDSTNKRFFYFINNKIYKSSTSCILEVELDVYSTYLFDHSLLTSFVERCHVNRWKTKGKIPNEEQIVDEGFPEFQSVVAKKTVINRMPDGCYIYASTQPLGTGIINKTGSGGGITSTKGIITKQGFRFIKGFEGFTPTGCYLNGENFKTVGYGSTELYNKDYYDKHKPFPCSEQLASEIYAERIIDEFGKRIWQELQSDGIADQITLNMFDAMCALAYNRGINGFLYDDTSPYRKIIKNPTDFSTIRTAWEKYAITSNGEILNGLISRRKAEADIYEFANYEMRAIGKYKVVNETGVQDGYITENDGNGFIPEYLPDINQTIKGEITDEHGNTWSLPTSGRITESFPNYRDGEYHGGIDFANNEGTPIYATGDGVVRSKQIYNDNKYSMPYGNCLVIEQEGNKTKQTYRMYYAHLNEFAKGLEEGVKVSKGELIGYMGTTGNSTGPHLHYEQRAYPYSPQVDTAIHPATNLSVDKEV